MRKSIHILGTYVDDIDRSMKQFSEGNFDVQPEVEWRGDFVGILQSFMEFQNSMSDTVRGIQRVSDEVSNGAEQVASSSNELADGATNQAAVVEELPLPVFPNRWQTIHRQQRRSAEKWNSLDRR